ncbi:MAG: hypothetical protein DMG14_35315, partial [Acidobacteria bacterium]
MKVLDFGLAKAFQTELSNAHLSDSPTLSPALRPTCRRSRRKAGKWTGGRIFLRSAAYCTK